MFVSEPDVRPHHGRTILMATFLAETAYQQLCQPAIGKSWTYGATPTVACMVPFGRHSVVVMTGECQPNFTPRTRQCLCPTIQKGFSLRWFPMHPKRTTADQPRGTRIFSGFTRDVAVARRLLNDPLGLVMEPIMV